MLRVLHPGVSSTIQDRGRTGSRSVGVPVSGCFDRFSAAIANALVGNVADEAVVEWTSWGGVYEAEATLALAIAGAPVEAAIESTHGVRPIACPQSLTLHHGERLVLKAPHAGLRSYLAVRGGWKTPVILGSRSNETRLKPGDLLPAEGGRIPTRRPRENPWRHEPCSPIRYVKGPDAACLAAGTLPDDGYVVSDHSNRMGVRLEGERLGVRSDPSRLSSPVCPGTIQVAGGLPLVLGPACGTLGGYPNVAQVIAADIDRLGRMRPGDAIHLREVGLAEARRLDRLASQELSRWSLTLASFAD